MSEEKDFMENMPEGVKPPHTPVKANMKDPILVTVGKPRKKMSLVSKIVWGIILIIVIVGLVQFFNAAKYSALVQVIKEDRLGVNPTGNALDFGDLPRGKSAIRTVNLVSNGNTGSYIVVWKFGGISDLMKVDKNYFTLKPHTTEKLEFTTYIPNSADYKYYKGNVVIFQIPKIW